MPKVNFDKLFKQLKSFKDVRYLRIVKLLKPIQKDAMDAWKGILWHVNNEEIDKRSYELGMAMGFCMATLSDDDGFENDLVMIRMKK